MKRSNFEKNEDCLLFIKSHTLKRNILRSIYISTIDINVSYIYIHYILAIEYKLYFVRVVYWENCVLYQHTVLQYLNKRDEETSERTLPRACKMSHCKVFGRQCFAGKIESPRTGAILIAAGCDLTPIPQPTALTTPRNASLSIVYRVEIESRDLLSAR